MSSTLFPGVGLITGASSGIGKATATSFAQEGCTRIVLADISEVSLTTTQESLTKSYPNTQFLAIPTDISSPEAVRNLFRKAVEKFGRIDYAVNCAGVLGAAKKSHEMTLEEFDHIVNVDYRTPTEIADCILFLCSPKSSFVQGAALVADGGYTIN
ncbi:unnamed protein product [Aureobasidium pullulans]|nr:unnamed protein product [Aureobasidium pullulans]